MKKFKVLLVKGHHAKPDQIIDGCLGNIFGDGKITLYDRGDAIKKARMFGGKAKEVEGLHNVIGSLSMQTISENALLDGVVKLLKEHTAFEDTNSDLNEKIYQGDIFEQILSEKTLIEERGLLKESLPKVLGQLEELAELISADYVMITQS